MSKIDWTKRRLFADIQGEPDSELVDVYEGNVMSVISDLVDYVHVTNFYVYVVPNKAVFGGSGEEGWIYLINNGFCSEGSNIGYTPSKVYKSLPQCMAQAEKSFLESTKYIKDMFEGRILQNADIRRSEK